MGGMEAVKSKGAELSLALDSVHSDAAVTDVVARPKCRAKRSVALLRMGSRNI